jgi:hypothetical protein
MAITSDGEGGANETPGWGFLDPLATQGYASERVSYFSPLGGARISASPGELIGFR